MKNTERYAVLFGTILLLGVLYLGFYLPNETPEIDDFQLNSINYTGLPSNEDVKVYPENHLINGNSFKLVFENNRDTELYWGAEWKTEKWIRGEWKPIRIDWAWVSLLVSAEPHSTVVTTEKFPFSEGLYRISKNCMLTDVYLRDEERWESEFIVEFYLLKTSK